jgi:hypothetical protein
MWWPRSNSWAGEVRRQLPVELVGAAHVWSKRGAGRPPLVMSAQRDDRMDVRRSGKEDEGEVFWRTTTGVATSEHSSPNDDERERGDRREGDRSERPIDWLCWALWISSTYRLP